MEKPNHSLETKEALKILQDDLEQHLKFFSQAAADLSLNQPLGQLDPSIYNELQRRFHLLKGSSGFLGLNELRMLAERGEELVRKLEEQVYDLSMFKDEFKLLCAELRKKNKLL